MDFYVGIYQKSHINYVVDKFCLSYRRLRKYKKTFPIPQNLEWMLDSGAFQELRLNGKYTFTPEEYFEKVREYRPNLFVNMDYMCEPSQMKKTGLSIKEHQKLSLENQIILSDYADDESLELMGTIQGWLPHEYIGHIDFLKEHGQLKPYMGVGSVCRRNAEKEIIKILKTIRKNLPSWVKLHGFGIKISLLKFREVYDLLDNCDSMAWSFQGRKQGEKFTNRVKSLWGHQCLVDDTHVCEKNTDDCANCGRYMDNWVRKIHRLIEHSENQQSLRSYLHPTASIMTDSAKEEK